jgi:hypothetical protein
MKFNNLLLVLSTMLLLSNCTSTNTVEAIIEPVPVVKSTLIDLSLTELQQKMIPYSASQVITFQLHTNENLAYLAKPREVAKYVTESYASGVQQLITYEIMKLAILPNQDSLKCMLFTVNGYKKQLEILVEDNLAGKWNYFRLDYDEKSNFYLDKNASGNTVELNNRLIINGIEYNNVYQVTNLQNDKLWFSLQNGVLKAELADGRTWNKKG